MQCPNCHTQGKWPFCNECGQKMEDMAILMCKGLLGGTTCGKVLDPNINFCSNCGASASSTKSFDQEVLCSCGENIHSDKQFCANCGTNKSTRNGDDMSRLRSNMLVAVGLRPDDARDDTLCQSNLSNTSMLSSKPKQAKEAIKEEESETETPVKRSRASKSATSTTKDAVVTNGTAPTRGRGGGSAEAREAAEAREEEDNDDDDDDAEYSTISIVEVSFPKISPPKKRKKKSDSEGDAEIEVDSDAGKGRKSERIRRIQESSEEKQVEEPGESLMDKQSKTSRSMDVTPAKHRTAKKPQSADAQAGRGSRDRPSTPENQSMMSDAQKTSNSTMETSLFDIDASAIQPDVSLLNGDDMSRLRSNVGSGRTRSGLRPDGARDDTLCQSNLSNTSMLSSKPKQEDDLDLEQDLELNGGLVTRELFLKHIFKLVDEGVFDRCLDQDRIL